MNRNRKSIRLKGYNYAQAGLYFITICTHNRKHLFGEITGGQMILNDSGTMAVTCWQEIPKHFPNTVLHEYVVMPNHVHGIIEIIGPPDKLSPAGVNNDSPMIQDAIDNGAKDVSPLHTTPFRSPSQSIGSIIRGFKTGVTKWFRDKKGSPPNLPVWQRNYYEHIIRNDAECNQVVQYIINNPFNWEEDRFY